MSFSPCASVPQRLGGMSAPFCDDHCIFLRHDVVHDVFELRESAQAIFRSASFIARIVSHICMLVRECGVHRTTYCSRIDERMPLCTEDLTWLLPVTISLENLRVRTRMRRPRFSTHAAHALFKHFSCLVCGSAASPSDQPFETLCMYQLLAGLVLTGAAQTPRRGCGRSLSRRARGPRC